MNDQLQLYAEKIEYERNKNKQRNQIFSKREKDLLIEISDKNKKIKFLSDTEGKMKEMLELKDKAINQAYHQFEITQQSLNEELGRAKNNEKKLASSLETLQGAPHVVMAASFLMCCILGRIGSLSVGMVKVTCGTQTRSSQPFSIAGKPYHQVG